MLDILIGMELLQLAGFLLLLWEVRKLRRTMAEPLRRAVTSKGPQILEAALTADFYKTKRDTFAKDSTRWKLYDRKFKDLLQ